MSGDRSSLPAGLKRTLTFVLIARGLSAADSGLQAFSEAELARLRHYDDYFLKGGQPNHIWQTERKPSKKPWEEDELDDDQEHWDMNDDEDEDQANDEDEDDIDDPDDLIDVRPDR